MAKDPNPSTDWRDCTGRSGDEPGWWEIFPHEASALRLISAVLAEIHEEWLTDRQYLNLAGWKKQVEQFFPTGPKDNYRKTVA